MDYCVGITMLKFCLASMSVSSCQLTFQHGKLQGTFLEGWCKSWMGGDYTPLLTPKGWFKQGHQPGVHIWTPPPVAALVALKELARSRHKHPFEVTHVVMIPWLLWDEEWQSWFEKEVDVWFILHNGSIWPHFAFEPLMVGFSFPILSPSSSYPWQVR
jgi:hypothetical protein